MVFTRVAYFKIEGQVMTYDGCDQSEITITVSVIAIMPPSHLAPPYLLSGAY